MPVKYILKLFILASNFSSQLALKNLNNIISNGFVKDIRLIVIDIRTNPQLAETFKILAVPTLIRELPLPVKKFVGDFSDKEKVLSELGIVSLNDKNNQKR
jgi:circadian clock protein KaiB